jgi:CubicO group peptidase (beta-lactamase class C family)
MVSWTRLARLLGVLLLCAAGVAPAPAAAPLDPVQVSRWADAFVGEGLRLTGTPGAVIVVVQDGRIVLARG